MKRNKAILFICGCLAVSLVSCDDYLTETPTVSISDDEAFESASDFTNNLNGVYYTFGNYNFAGRNVLLIGDVCSDDSQHSSSTGHWRQLAHWQVYDTDEYLEAMWEYGYEVIDRCTRIIENAYMVDELPESSEATINQAVAEAYSLRALALLYLTNIWGLPYNDTNKSTLGVVNVTTTISEGETVSRNTVGENFEQMLSDIENSKTYFAKDGVESSGTYYMNPAAVYALEARVKLFMQDYSGAITAAQSAIDLFDGSLITTADGFETAWSSTTASSEDLFTIAKSASDNPGANSLRTMYTSYSVSLRDEWLEQFSDTDIRTEVMNLYGGKYMGTSDGAYANNIPIFRLPDLYLTIAEAEAELGDYEAAKENLLIVVEARNSMEESAIPNTSAIISVIHTERSKELTQEGFRLFDARRWGEKITVAGGTYTDFDVAKFVYPIPAAEINSSYGVTQTENWSSYLPN